MNNKKRLGVSFEKKIVEQAKEKGVKASLQPLSGQMPDAKGDIDFGTFLAECKVRAEKIDAVGNRYIHLDTQWVEKINKEAIQNSKSFGVVITKMKQSKSSYTVLRTGDFLDLVKRACLLGI